MLKLDTTELFSSGKPVYFRRTLPFNSFISCATKRNLKVEAQAQEHDDEIDMGRKNEEN